jgi:hypothetical protein
MARILADGQRPTSPQVPHSMDRTRILANDNIEIQVHPVNGFELEGDVILENLSDAV